MKPAEVKKITTILFAQELEPCIQFWSGRLGFQKTVEVPEGNKIGFVILEKNGLELMYQSFASVDKDNAATGEARAERADLFVPGGHRPGYSAGRHQGRRDRDAGAFDFLWREGIWHQGPRRALHYFCAAGCGGKVTALQMCWPVAARKRARRP